ncbi:MAG TPA: signal recognition particle protein [Nitrospirae bacterium]|nr:signal recognition particle protein [bacterium BMS3Bbin09]HDN94517.1 signal recognition particle protein [Nitrospirota bacterium]HDO67532.1 signal recognition particle protein [Nitrospirota bacterium]HDZ84510.1 signal recognition particle protein [Nitrospirota bacterium]HEW81706.1 signal recognition particle protein [Nitrospirota bacterium]
MFESLSDRLEGIFKKLKGRGFLSEDDVNAGLKEVRMALLEADVNFKVVKDFVEKVRVRAVGKEVIDSIAPGQQVVKIVNDELCALMGGHSSKINLAPNPPTVIMLVGLHGCGKTTTSAKLANNFKKDGRRPMLVAMDTGRPAAIDQLKVLGAQIDVPVYATKPGDDPVTIFPGALKAANLEGRDILILDTAGRLHIDDDLMGELDNIKKAAKPSEILLVADAMTGQDAVNIAKTFNDRLDLQGVVLTKMDGDARGGAALSIAHVTGKPIKFIGVGEKIDFLEPFHPDRMASRILGMGDVVTLVEKAQDTMNLEDALKMEGKLKNNRFTYEDLKDQIKQIKKMGSLESILGMIPGLGKQLKGVNIDEKAFVKVEAIINSMTVKERNNYVILNGSRKKRIAAGSGTAVADVNKIIKQHLTMKKMLKKFKRGKGMGMPQFKF